MTNLEIARYKFRRGVKFTGLGIPDIVESTGILWEYNDGSIECRVTNGDDWYIFGEGQWAKVVSEPDSCSTDPSWVDKLKMEFYCKNYLQFGVNAANGFLKDFDETFNQWKIF